MESNHYILNSETPVEDLGDGVTRQLLGYNDQLMMVKVSFLKGAVGTLHTHEHTQSTYCASGVFKFTIGDETRTVGEGDATYIPPGVLHGVVCLQEGVLIDSFHPVRLDFLK
jgi:quercetin dioxygenase-like cupin family protein